MLYLRARWYDPQQGRFLSRDPWDGDLSNPQTLNPYAYAHSQPTRYTDPSGKWVDESGNWHPCNLLTETASCIGQLPGWFTSNDIPKFGRYAKGVGKSVIKNLDPLNLGALFTQLQTDPIGTAVAMAHMPANMAHGMITALRNCDYEAMGELSGDIGLTLYGGAELGVGLVGSVGSSRYPPSVLNDITSVQRASLPQIVVELGSGSEVANIVRLADRFPSAKIYGIDADLPSIQLAEWKLKMDHPAYQQRIELIHSGFSRYSGSLVGQSDFTIVIEPRIGASDLTNAIDKFARPKTPVEVLTEFSDVKDHLMSTYPNAQLSSQYIPSRSMAFTSQFTQITYNSVYMTGNKVWNIYIPAK